MTETASTRADAARAHYDEAAGATADFGVLNYGFTTNVTSGTPLPGPPIRGRATSRRGWPRPR